MVDEFKFQIGQMYENMKGVYEVISIHKDKESMLIRWVNGHEATTPMDLQKRIIERMGHEKSVRKQKDSDTLKKNEKLQNKGAIHFSGFDNGDFKTTSKNTTWRARTNLGGSVVQELNSDKPGFSSWAVLMRPEVHWMDAQRHKGQGPHCGICFSVRVNPTNLHYGIHVHASATDRNGWEDFRTWLTRKENETWLKRIATDHALTIHDATKESFTHDIRSNGDQWEWTEGQTRLENASLTAFFASLDATHPLELKIEKMIAKEEVISKKEKIVAEISTFFDLLMPIYQVSHVLAQ